MSSQLEQFNKITDEQQRVTVDLYNYWVEYSSFDTWQFWLTVLFFVAPLVVVYFKIDRKRAFQIGFYGFNVHVWLSYIDTFGTNQGYWGYPFQMIIQLPNSIFLDASLVPVLFMFVYQWTIQKEKNYYLYTFLLIAFLSFVLKPILALHNFIEFYHGATYLHLFIGYVIIMFLSKLITDLFLFFEKKN